jgi:hypothetical protein
MLTVQPFSIANSGRSPKRATPSKTPALKGNTQRERRSALFNQTPSKLDAVPTTVARTGASSARLGLTKIKTLL